jgi:DNA-binding GntR family transcriptional regulator
LRSPFGQLCEEHRGEQHHHVPAVATLVVEGLLAGVQARAPSCLANMPASRGHSWLISFSQDMQLRGWRRGVRMLSLVKARAEPAVATKLGLAQGAGLHVLRRLRLADDRAAALQTAHLTLPALPGLRYL